MQLKFDEEKHLYTLDDKPLTGVTTILGVIAKPSLIQWASSMACDFVRNNLKTMEDLEAVLKEASVAHRKKKEASADTGTFVHKMCELWIAENKIEGENRSDEDLFLLTVEQLHLDMKEAEIIEGQREMVFTMFGHFKKWALDNEVEFLESEVRCYSEKYWYAGTCDLVLKIKGEVWIGDIKTSSGIYDEAFYQTSAYQNALQEQGLYPLVKGHVILNLKKDGKFDVKFSENYEEDRKAFMGALAIYRRKNQTKPAKKPRVLKTKAKK